ncbi:hypothetical protein [Mesorhizobium marinum]|uniref:HTH cro/C1-type domain-containing protein n=1 Tax=Mesorhizobium marinum TaxID=3228790 RepID=A0ABV3R2A5_9HYPH
MRLRAMKHGGAAAIIQMLNLLNLADLATQTGLRKARLAELASGNEKVKPATSDELTTLCGSMSSVLRYIVDGDAIATDAAMAIRMALFGRDLARVSDAGSIAADFLERYRDGADCLSADDLDLLATILFDGRLKIDRETGELVAIGRVAVPTIARKVRPVSYPTQPTDNYHVNRAISLDPNGLAPVATGSEVPGMAILKPEPPRAGYARFEARLRAIAEGR